MVRTSNIGILGIGTYLPDHVRRNDWWPEHVVATWTERRARARAKLDAKPTSEGMSRVMNAMSELQDDPFQGAVERRVMDDGMVAVDMEVRAAKQAIERAGIDPREIDLVLCHTTVPEYLLTNSACLLHHRLGLSMGCFTMATEASANSFLMQLTLAEQMIAGGRSRYGLLVQSCSVSRLLDASDPLSPLFGDAATAVVVGRVSEGRGILGSTQRTDGSANRTLVATVANGRWYDAGPVVLHSPDPEGARQVFLETADRGKEAVDAALADAGHEPSQVDFFAVHQGTPWFRRVMQEHFGLESAASVGSFSSTGYVFAASIPLGLAIGEREGQLRPDDLLLMFGGGTGLTYGATVVRWGGI